MFINYVNESIYDLFGIEFYVMQNVGYTINLFMSV